MNSMFTVTGQVINTFMQAGNVNKETGEVGESSAKVQIMGEQPVKGGSSKFELVTLTVEDEKNYSVLKGKRVRVPLGFFSPSKGSIVLFIPKGSKVEVLA